VRELENLIERAIVLAEPDGSLDVHHLFTGGEKFSHPLLNLSRQGGLEPASDGAEESREANVERLIDAVLRRLPRLRRRRAEAAALRARTQRGNVSAAARLLKLRRGQVEYRLKARKPSE